MKTSLLYFSLLFLFCSHLLFISAASSKLNEVCKLLDRYNENVTPELCLSVLESDPKSCTADLDGLGVIAANITATNATVVAAQLKHFLLNGSLNHKQEEAVTRCIQYFTNTTANMQVAMESIKCKKYRTAEYALFQAFEAGSMCEDEVKDDVALDVSVSHYVGPFPLVSAVAYALGQYLVDSYHG